MNAPLPEHLRRALETVTLDDKYALAEGRAFMSGVQALVRLPMLQQQRDAEAGLRTAGFISGYRGSPLGTYDQALWAARKHLAKHDIVFQPGVNEELGATAVWGTQQLDLYPETKKFDGVFGIWYGKGPGVDRCSDVFKHANMAGTARHGGVLAIAGDDHISKSSTAAHQSDHIFKACSTPVFFPSSVQDILDMGLHGIAMSRFSGLWSGMKTIQEVVESSSSVSIDPDRVKIVLPEDFVMPPGGLHIRWPDAPLEQEARMMDYKWYAALAYVRANRLNYNVIEGPNDRFGLIASGKAYNDMRQALVDLGLDDDVCRQLGIRVHKVNVVWPLEATITREFARGLQEILVVEEKRQVIEYQIKEELYNWRSDVRPNVLGKFDEGEGDTSGGEWSQPNPSQNWLLRAKADLTPALIAKAIAKRLKKLGMPEHIVARMEQRLAVIDARERALAAPLVETGERQPWFCSGCPHNTSTRVPEGSRAVAGIGCHYMVTWMPDRNTSTFTQMGGEGVSWIGQAPFTGTDHIFANLGDGTYMHSGSLAIRASKAAGVNITYKILVNDAVAMTGGQPVEGAPTVPQILQQVAAEGVEHIYLVTDEPDLYQGMAGLPAGVPISHRDGMDALQKSLREKKGVSVIVYAQVCAAEKRRRRKRKELVDPPKRVVINEEVCEGCGDCGVQSNCVSILPLETPLGRKRIIDQNSCNKDYSCVKGFCPSFVTVEGGTLRKPSKAKATLPEGLPMPVLPRLDAPCNVVITGVGGTGVVTIGALMGMAAHLEGKGVLVLDMAGLAQKGGAVMSNVRLAATPAGLHAARVAARQADVVVGCDLMVAAAKDALGTMSTSRTRAVLNMDVAPTGAFTQNPDWQTSPEGMLKRVSDATLQTESLNASAIATALMGDAVATNVFLLGYTWQKGWIALKEASLMRAIELNGAAIAMNKAAFAWGRQAALDLGKVRKAAGLDKPGQVILMPARTMPLEALMADRIQRLSRYQNAAYARRYEAVVREIAATEKQRTGSDRLAREVAVSLYKLMAYKDEYEVARLYVETGFFERIGQQFEGDYKLRFHLAPPLFSKRDAQGRLVKSAYGPWIATAYQWLAKAKGLRGTALDLFGYTAERRHERAAIGEFEALMRKVANEITQGNTKTALELARLPQSARGYGHVKENNERAAAVRQAQLLKEFAAGQAEQAPERAVA